MNELIAILAHNLIDPDPIGFRQADEAGVGPVRIGCGKPLGTLHKFRTPLNRNAFLCGCLDYTDHAPIEHLIVGFGLRRGSTTIVASMSHVTGGPDKVSIPPHFEQTTHGHVNALHANEVILFHNHPRGLINAIFDNIPLASMTDRRALLAFLTKQPTLYKAMLGGGRPRFFIGENGYVKEIVVPDLTGLFGSNAPGASAP